MILAQSASLRSFDRVIQGLCAETLQRVRQGVCSSIEAKKNCELQDAGALFLDAYRLAVAMADPLFKAENAVFSRVFGSIRHVAIK